MGVSTTHRINLSMWILIYSFSDTYYVWAACDFISLWYERNVFLLDKVHSTNLERFTWRFKCGTNWLFYGTIWLLIGTIWLGTMSTIWPWNRMTGYRHAPSRLPMNKLKSLLQKTRKVTLKSIRKNTPLSSEIHCYVKSTKGLHLNRYRSNCNSVEFLLKGQLQN